MNRNLSKSQAQDLIDEMRRTGHICGVHMGQAFCRQCGRKWADTLLGDILAKHLLRRGDVGKLMTQRAQISRRWEACGYARSLEQILALAPFEWTYTGDGGLAVEDRDDYEIMDEGPELELFLCIKESFHG